MHALRSFLFAPGDALGGGGGAAAGAAPVIPAGGAAAGAAPIVGAGGGPAGATAGAGAAAAAPAPWYKDWIKDDGTINRDSYARMPEALRGLSDSELKNPATVEQVMQKLQSLSSLAGRKALAALPPNASPEDRAAFDLTMHTANGAPEKPEGYGFKKADALPDAAWDPNYATAIQGILHKHHASPALAQELLAAQTAQVSQNIVAQGEYEKQFFKEQDEHFRTALTKDGLDYDKSMNVITRAAVNFGMAADAPMLKNAGVRLMMLKVAQSIGEAKFIGGEATATGLKSDRATAEDIVHNKKNPDYEAYWNANHAQNGEVKKRVLALLESAAKAERAEAGRR